MRRLILCCIFLVIGHSTLAQDQTSARPIDVSSQLYGMKLAPDGRTVATYEYSAIHNEEVVDHLLPIRLFDVDTGEARLVLTGPADYARDIAFSPDSTMLATYHATGFVYVWDVENGALLHEILTLPDGGLIRFMPDNQMLILSIFNQLQPHLVFIDVETGAITQVLMQRYTSREAINVYLDNVRVPAETILAFDVMPNGEDVILATGSDHIKLWNIAQGHEIFLRKSEEEIPRFDIRTVMSLPDSSGILYSNLSEGTITRIDLETGAESTVAEGEIVTFGLADDGNMIAWLERGDDSITLHTMSLTDPDQKSQIPVTLPESLIARPPTLTLAFTPDYQQVVIGGFANLDSLENQILIIDLA